MKPILLSFLFSLSLHSADIYEINLDGVVQVFKQHCKTQWIIENLYSDIYYDHAYVSKVCGDGDLMALDFYWTKYKKANNDHLCFYKYRALCFNY